MMPDAHNEALPVVGLLGWAVLIIIVGAGAYIVIGLMLDAAADYRNDKTWRIWNSHVDTFERDFISEPVDLIGHDQELMAALDRVRLGNASSSTRYAETANASRLP